MVQQASPMFRSGIAPRAGQRDAVGQCAAVLAVAGLLLWPAIYNGYPLLYPDSALYIALSFAPQEYPPRGLTYPVLMHGLHWGVSLWLVILAQAVLASWVLHETVAVFAVRRRAVCLLGLGALLAALTGLPWTTDQVMPDFGGGPMVLALAIVTLYGDRLNAVRRLVLLAVAALGVAIHASFAPVAVAIVLLALIARRWLRLSWRDIVRPAAATVGGAALAIAVQWAITGYPYYSQGGQQFLFGRLVDDGIVADYLDIACPNQPLQLCAFKDRLPHTHNEYLWTQPAAFKAMGGWNPSPELRHIMLDSALHMPLRHLGAVVADTARQLVHIAVGESMGPPSAPASRAVEIAFPGEADQFHAARQLRDGLDPMTRQLNVVQMPVQLAALAALVMVVALRARAGQRRSAGFGALVLAALLINAFVCGVFSGATERYQNRVAWLAVVAVLATGPTTGQRARNGTAMPLPR